MRDEAENEHNHALHPRRPVPGNAISCTGIPPEQIAQVEFGNVQRRSQGGSGVGTRRPGTRRRPLRSSGRSGERSRGGVEITIMILWRNNRYLSESPFTSFILLLASTPEADPQCEPHDADGGRQNNDFGRSDTIGARYRNHKPLPSTIAIAIAAVPSPPRSIVDGHAKFKPILKTKQSSQPRATSPTCVSRVTWDEISLNKSLCQKLSHPTKNPTKMRTDTHHTRSPTKGSCKRATNESHKNNRSKGSHVRGIPQAYRMYNFFVERVT